MQNLDEAIRERAYHLWIAAGRPDGRADGYWLDAQREILTASLPIAETALAAAIKSAAVAKKPAKKAKAAAPKKSKSRAA